VRNAVGALCLLPLLLPCSAGADEPRTVTVTGAAAIDVTPDQAVIALGVETFAETVSAAKERNNQTSARLLEAIRAMGIAELDISTDRLRVTPQPRDEEHPAKGLAGFFVERGYTVTVRDLQRLPALVDGVLANGANTLHSIEFGSSEASRHRESARQEAVRAARSKAETLAAALGAELGFVRSITEEDPGWSSSMNSTVTAARPGPGEGTIPAGLIRVRAKVAVAFDLYRRAETRQQPAGADEAGRAQD
jgi:uncharacterized protein YggE